MKELARFDRLYELLPPIYRDRDAEQNYPLRDLLRVTGEQVLAVENDVAQLYEDWFIETCADWAVPYIGDLIGYHPVRGVGEAGSALVSVLAPRREVANTIRFRRRKGTLAVLDDLAQAITGWPARAAEVVPTATAPADVQVTVWRLRAFSVTRTRAYRVRGELGSFRFSILGNDVPLFARPAPRSDPHQPLAELNLPVPLPRTMAGRIVRDGNGKRIGWAVPEDIYGQEKSFAIYAPNWPAPGASQPVPRELIVSRRLLHWTEPPEGILFIDPKLGRLRFPCDNSPHNIRVSYHYGAPAAIGGGEYERELSEPAGAIFYTVAKGTEFNDALALWASEQPRHAVIEIADSGYYPVVINVRISAGQSLQIRAARGARPVLVLDDDEEDAPGAFIATGEPGSRFTLDGLLLVGAPVRIAGPTDEEPAPENGPPPQRPCPFDVVIRHCTLVPGLSFDHECYDEGDGICGCEMSDCEKASLELIAVNGLVTIEHCILGTIRVEQDVVATDPLPIDIRDSIVDCAHAEDEPQKPQAWNFEAHHAIFSKTCGRIAHAALRLARCTIFGWVKTHAITAANDCIFADHVHVARRQLGCMRFCSVPPGSRTPRRYQCQPDRAITELAAAQSPTPLTPAQEDQESQRVAPDFITRDFGQPDYARPAQDCSIEISSGAEDESEMGVFHDLYEPQRAENLRARLAEFVPVNSETAVVFAT